ncbi:hypothetical protein LIER_20463 [Lithospermum erythrorhizon]|uniref:Uncharacterized protein n=1 Tax=Lithospermum erythrorhizon TaxID=34254 RepID=A0AAV3QNV7_LITER
MPRPPSSSSWGSMKPPDKDYGPIVNPCCFQTKSQGGAASPPSKNPSNNNFHVPQQPSPLSSTSKHRYTPMGVLTPTPSSSGGRVAKTNESSNNVKVVYVTHGGDYLLAFLLLGLFYFMKKIRKPVTAMHGGEFQI